MSCLGQRLKELRNTRSLAQVEKATGIKRIEISRYERGMYAPSPPNLTKLAQFYEVSYAVLRILYYEDLLQDPREREIVLMWARQNEAFAADGHADAAWEPAFLCPACLRQRPKETS